MKINKVAIIVNNSKENAIEKAKDFIGFLKTKEVNVAVPSNDKDLFGINDCDIDSAEIAVTFGGDGTVLRAVKLLEDKSKPLLTVNFGRVGFLAELQPDKLEESFEKYLSDEFSLEKKRILKGSIDGKEEIFALNDIIITHYIGDRTLNLDVYIKDSFLYTYSCDGFVVASPTGSTAYSLSLGGPVVTSKVNAKVLIPINPHTLFNKSIVVSQDEPVMIKTNDSEKISILADGSKVESDEVKQIEIRLSDTFVNLIRLNGNHFIDELKERLFKL